MICRFFEKKTFLLALLLLFLPLQGCSSRYSITSTKYTGYEGEINQHTRLIRAERNQIFQVLTREDALKTICPKGTVVAFESPPPFGVGTLVKTEIFSIFKMEWNSRVEEVIPDIKIRLKFQDGFFSGGMEIWELEEDSEYTRVSHTIIFRPRGFLKNLVWVLKVRSKHDRMVESFLNNLKRVSETH